jgi:arabinofuranosyltransferase
MLQHFYRIWQHSLPVIIILLAVTAVAVNAIFFLAKYYIDKRKTSSFSFRDLAFWGFCCLLAGGAYILIYQPDYPQAKVRTLHELSIRAVDKGENGSLRGEVFLRRITIGEDVRDYTLESGLVRKTGKPFSMIFTSASAPERITILFQEDPDSGVVEISIDDKLMGTRDLYAAVPGDARFTTETPLPIGARVLDRSLRVIDILSISWLMFLTGLTLRRFNIRDPLNLAKDSRAGDFTFLWNPILIFELIILISLVTQRAWVGDDSFITFRTVQNFVNGYGLTWNTFERVQAYTNPLWMLVMSAGYFITKDVFYTSIAIGLLLSAGTAILVTTRTACSTLSATAALAVMFTSYAFLDYSTSGLENSLNHLLIVLFYALLVSMEPSFFKSFVISLVASFGVVNRMDTGLVYLPGLALLFWENRGIKQLVLMAAGQMPFILWEAFSVIYYGFPFPNTAYAKLYTGIEPAALVQNGILYLQVSIQRDPVTLAACLAAVILTLIKKDRTNYLIALGMTAYLAYVVKIGGDFMSGRFLTVPFICAVIILARFDYRSLGKAGPVFLFFAIAACALISNPFYNPRYPFVIASQGIADERQIYTPGSALIGVFQNKTDPRPPWGVNPKPAARGVIIFDSIGMVGYYQGPQVKIIDPLGLPDPLISRLPAHAYNYLPGHYYRDIPEGYVETVATGINQIKNKDLAAFYEQMKIITQGPLSSIDRLGTILHMNRGDYAGLINR